MREKDCMRANSYQKLAFTTASIVLGLTAVPVNQAIAANLKTWNLTFYSSKGEQVGFGQFRYDLDKTTFVATEQVSGSSQTPPDGFYVRNALESFTATIMQQQWNLSEPGYTTWWADGSRAPGQQRLARGSKPFIAENSWFFGDPYLGMRQLNLNNMEFVSDKVWQGEWIQSIASQNGSNEGRWIAVGAPEPLTILGASTAIGFGIFFRRKIAKKTSPHTQWDLKG
jgi:hypothetical protein